MSYGCPYVWSVVGTHILKLRLPTILLNSHFSLDRSDTVYSHRAASKITAFSTMERTNYVPLEYLYILNRCFGNEL